MTLQEAKTKFEGNNIIYASGQYECIEVFEQFGCFFVKIYDEPPSKHVDILKLSSVELEPQNK